MQFSSPPPTDHAAIRRALSSLTATLGQIALRIETRRCEEHETEEAPSPRPADARSNDQEKAALPSDGGRQPLPWPGGADR